MKTDDLEQLFAAICRLGATPGGNMVLEALFPGTQEAVRKATETDFCFCGEPKSLDSLFCSSCLQERYATRKEEERELDRDLYGPDCAL